MARVHKRLVKGASEYGNRSFTRPPADLLEELAQEALDLAGWGFVLFTRIETLRAKARRSRAGRGARR